MSHITLDGDEFEIERTSRDKHGSTFVLHISLSNRNEVELPTHELKRVLNCGSRSNLTDDIIEYELHQFVEKYPDAEINGFGVIEETIARIGEKDN